jgi:predicted MFS family arabinose efflux permease
LNLSIVVSGLMSGMLIARFLSGVVSNFTSWRNIYWFACGAQFLLSLCLYLFMPDYPSKNPDGLNYFRALWSIPCIMVQEPLLVQACLMVFAMSCIFTTFWTTLTFLLSSAPYEYSTLTIGLFSLLTLPAIVSVPLFGKMIDKFVPHLSILIGELIVGTGLVIGTFISNMTVAGPIIQGICTDLGVQIVQVANRSAIFGIRPKARNRVNTAYMATAFVGQLTGTAVGNRLYAMAGWRASGGCSSTFSFFSSFLLFLLSIFH